MTLAGQILGAVGREGANSRLLRPEVDAQNQNSHGKLSSRDAIFSATQPIGIFTIEIFTNSSALNEARKSVAFENKCFNSAIVLKLGKTPRTYQTAHQDLPRRPGRPDAKDLY